MGASIGQPWGMERVCAVEESRVVGDRVVVLIYERRA
jgi:hypothetical protein